MRALRNQMSESSHEYEWVVGAPHGSFTLNCGTPRRKSQRGFVLVTGIQQGAPNHISRVRYEIGENGALGAAKRFGGQYRPLRALL